MNMVWTKNNYMLMQQTNTAEGQSQDWLNQIIAQTIRKCAGFGRLFCSTYIERERSINSIRSPSALPKWMKHILNVNVHG